MAGGRPARLLTGILKLHPVDSPQVSLNSDFLQEIEHPNHSNLQLAFEEGLENTAERLEVMGFLNPDDWLVRKIALVYFYDNEQDSPNFALVLPDPGNIGKEYTEEIRNLQVAGPDIDYNAQIEFYRDLVTTWFLTHNTDFPNEFFPLLRSNGLIDYSGHWTEYIGEGEFFDDFYMTDIIKYRVAGNRRSEWKDTAYRQHVKKELKEIDPNVIFVFGASAWGTIRKHLSPEPVHDSSNDESKITRAHGNLYYTDSVIDAFILPLGHMSGNSWWQFPPEDYVERLEAGLSELREVSKEGFDVSANLSESANEKESEPTVLDEIAQDLGEVSEFGLDT